MYKNQLSPLSKQPVLAELSDRCLIEVKGADAAAFLQGLITTDVKQIDEGAMMAGALLSPQGKVIFDFLVGKQGTSFFLDIARERAEILHKRLMLYKLRSQIEMILHPSCLVQIALKPSLAAGTDTPSFSLPLLIFRDKRFLDTEPIWRRYGGNSSPGSISQPEIWHSLRIDHGVAESGADFDLGDVFPHDINYDQIGGVSFQKGCYIGQEVVSRMHHRGIARRRLVLATGQTHLPPKGSVIEAAGKAIGTVGSRVGKKGLALVRLDRAKAAMDKALPIMTGAIEVKLSLLPSVRFTWPDGD